MQLYPNESSENVPEGDDQHGGDQFQDCNEGEAAEEMSAPRKLPDPVQPNREERMEHISRDMLCSGIGANTA